MGFPSESPFPQDSPTFFPLSEQCAPPPCSRLTHHYSPDTSHNASFSPPLVSAPAHQMMDKYFSNTPYTCTPIALSSFSSWNKHKNINLHHTHPLFVFFPAHLSLALCVSDTPCSLPPLQLSADLVDTKRLIFQVHHKHTNAPSGYKIHCMVQGQREKPH